MDAHNLAIVFTPNLIKSSNPIRDVQMCTIPSFSGSASSSKDSHSPTVGLIIKVCIERYFEIFDEVQDRSEAIPAAPVDNDEHATPQVSDDDDLDSPMLVMPVRPSSLPRIVTNSRLPPSAWGSGTNGNDDLSYKPRQQTRNRRVPSSHHDFDNASPVAESFSSGAAIRSVATGGTSAPFPSISKSRSMISIEKNSGPMSPSGTRRGSIRLGSRTSKGTIGKSAGAAVEALGITAAGFFAPLGGNTVNGNGTS